MNSNVAARADNLANLENKIIELWRRVLKTELIGLDDNFFDLGGHSLSLAAFHSDLKRVLHRDIPITDLFEFTTVRMLAERLAGDTSERLQLSQTMERARNQRAAFGKFRGGKKPNR
jgi:acyl carrier protein